MSSEPASNRGSGSGIPLDSHAKKVGDDPSASTRPASGLATASPSAGGTTPTTSPMSCSIRWRDWRYDLATGSGSALKEFPCGLAENRCGITLDQIGLRPPSRVWRVRSLQRRPEKSRSREAILAQYTLSSIPAPRVTRNCTICPRVRCHDRYGIRSLHES